MFSLLAVLLSVYNDFVVEEKKTSGLSYQSSVIDCDDRLLDCMNIGLVDMEVFTALRTDESAHNNLSFGYTRQVNCIYSSS